MDHLKVCLPTRSNHIYSCLMNSYLRVSTIASPVVGRSAVTRCSKKSDKACTAPQMEAEGSFNANPL